ncbi:hypothetical protein AGDE_02648 [Angomonas deanei]|uniref:Uncharacterized protein n=1 Tax=Angomonas deanei TaxID=59799 RepID=S9VEU6_9TRYP|nr:hypothetical protein AGDE_03981 [Angomonas deanei]EPY41277.1 hypothetical protein AGDE_02648 [Angomonas deanei]CAD2218653.1 hypothetical protein, conserved [Angomonas deanei]|eukprot:EPY39947.1 hypothetical protein AGDE_03981 [Angomonas deanei]
MCKAGHNMWMFTDSDACYVGTNNILKKCICPFTSCNMKPEGPKCEFTTSVVVLLTFLVLVWFAGVGTYVYLSSLITSMETEARNNVSADSGKNYYYEKLFGTPQSQTEKS